jgi:hypothetical protein
MDNIELLEMLIDEISINNEPDILHSLTEKILNVKYQDILGKLLNNIKPTGKAMNSLNDLGLTPFLAYIEHFCSRLTSLRAKAMLLVNAEAEKHGLQFSKYKITNASLFKKEAPAVSSGGRYKKVK